MLLRKQSRTWQQSKLLSFYGKRNKPCFMIICHTRKFLSCPCLFSPQKSEHFISRSAFYAQKLFTKWLSFPGFSIIRCVPFLHVNSIPTHCNKPCTGSHSKQKTTETNWQSLEHSDIHIQTYNFRNKRANCFHFVIQFKNDSISTWIFHPL